MKPCPYPIGHLLNPATKYVPACATDIRETFKHIRAWPPHHRSPIVTGGWLGPVYYLIASDGNSRGCTFPC